ncbi:Sugar and other transporter [Aspergillus sclerotialis]|uniref:Sugar and other transporter n=1 Tax=Aspergillus sclerotialis TaxID=2070753 RepID=A0A3A2ZUI1_9EURO|nr:Sugar and other transporter [Aspergillus sclerotialis]
MMYATSAIPLTWDQGSAATVSSLPGFQQHFRISSESGASSTRNFVSLVYIGDAVGAFLSFFINDSIGRLWSYRLYSFVWIIGQLVAIFSPGSSGLYASRIISGLGIGALSVTGAVSIVEIAPAQIRGLLTSWYSVFMGIALMASTFCVYGIELHVGASRLQYQIPWFSPCIFMFLWIAASFFLSESPRWLVLTGRNEEAVQTLVRLRRLPSHHTFVQEELQSIKESIHSETRNSADRSPFQIVSIAKETFTKPSNLRRVQQAIIMYALPQFSGGNVVTNYFVPILKVVGLGGGSTRNLFLTGMYTVAKFFFSLFASFFFIDALGRRNSLFVGIALQMASDIYLAAYINVQQNGHTSHAADEAALAAIFIHALGYAIGLLTLPYVFGGELWPNRIRSFGAALSHTFHWSFHYAMTFALPSLLSRTNNWGAFVFFAAWCAGGMLYVYLFVPEIAGLSVEEIEHIFSGPFIVSHKRSSTRGPGSLLEGQDLNKTSPDTKGQDFPKTMSSQKTSGEDKMQVTHK